MLKVSGQFVSPFEVESAIGTHEAVLEAAVIGEQDVDELLKPKAFVVLNPGRRPARHSPRRLKQHVKQTLAPFKYPRWIEFVDELPEDGDRQDPALQAAPRTTDSKERDPWASAGSSWTRTATRMCS